MPDRPCLGCGKLIASGSRCSRCKPRRFNKKLRGSGGRAATFRRRTLKTHGDACIVCGSRDGVQAHHLGETDEEGGVPLCRRHHRQVTAAENQTRVSRRREG